ncbi:hypothetical protein PF008_g23257 [Phytophthora fragariae]|uniref:Uncharacterized protein n=1 Tax=Phytophthora fragariae TaxID=53985 RepID=A0A6G0QS89_9STRA|nr:hypothetical protein PF008_g23257 [Phytophthora fragariae]
MASQYGVLALQKYCMCRAAARGWRRGVLAAAVGNMASQYGILVLQKYCWCCATAHGWRKECSLLQLWASWPHSVASWHCSSAAGAAQQLMAGASGVAVVLDSVGMAALVLLHLSRVQTCSGPMVPWMSSCDLGSGCPSGTWQSTL